MTDLERIESSVPLQMALSELLFKALGMGCWHEWEEEISGAGIVCYKCDNLVCDDIPNPNLFTRESFLDVFKAVKDRGFEKYAKANSLFCRVHTIKDSEGYRQEISLVWIDPYIIASPHFQLSVLGWLLEKDGEGERLTSILRGIKE